MNTVDIIVVVVVVISGLLAFSRGMVRELLSVGGWVAAALVTLYAYPYTQPLARKYITTSRAGAGARASRASARDVRVAGATEGQGQWP